MALTFRMKFCQMPQSNRPSGKSSPIQGFYIQFQQFQCKRFDFKIIEPKMDSSAFQLLRSGDKNITTFPWPIEYTDANGSALG